VNGMGEVRLPHITRERVVVRKVTVSTKTFEFVIPVTTAVAAAGHWSLG
jgi:hypothetical protein